MAAADITGLPGTASSGDGTVPMEEGEAAGGVVAQDALTSATTAVARLALTAAAERAQDRHEDIASGSAPGDELAGARRASLVGAGELQASVASRVAVSSMGNGSSSSHDTGTATGSSQQRANPSLLSALTEIPTGASEASVGGGSCEGDEPRADAVSAMPAVSAAPNGGVSKTDTSGSAAASSSTVHQHEEEPAAKPVLSSVPSFSAGPLGEGSAAGGAAAGSDLGINSGGAAAVLPGKHELKGSIGGADGWETGATEEGVGTGTEASGGSVGAPREAGAGDGVGGGPTGVGAEACSGVDAGGGGEDGLDVSLCCERNACNMCLCRAHKIRSPRSSTVLSLASTRSMA